MATSVFAARHCISRAEAPDIATLPTFLPSLRPETELIRWAVVEANPEFLSVEATWGGPPRKRLRPRLEGRSPAGGAVLNLTPTGIGCEIGGYAGDAAPATVLLAACADLVITNPNTVNASDFVRLPSNVLYTEGGMIDDFSEGLHDLYQPLANRIGVIVDRTDDVVLSQVENVINAVRAVHGANVIYIGMTEEPIGARFKRMPSGAFTGDINDPAALLGACAGALQQGATALAITSSVDSLPDATYREHFEGKAPNPVGGAEAVVSRVVSRHFGVPVAHAPLLNEFGGSASPGVVDPRGGGEAASISGLASVLIGLQRAPHPAPDARLPHLRSVTSEDLLCVVAPAGSLGSPAVLAANRRAVPVIAVRGNHSILDVTGEALGLHGVYEVEDYLAAAGIIMAMRCGLAIETVTRPLLPLAVDFQPVANRNLANTVSQIV